MLLKQDFFNFVLNAATLDAGDSIITLFCDQNASTAAFTCLVNL